MDKKGSLELFQLIGQLGGDFRVPLGMQLGYFFDFLNELSILKISKISKVVWDQKKAWFLGYVLCLYVLLEFILEIEIW